MLVVRGHGTAPTWGGAAVAIGNFDGVHLGHRALIERACAIAQTTPDTQAIALTFEPHPSAITSSKGPPARITTPERRLELLGEAGLAATVIEPFTPALAATSAEAFVETILVAGLRARAVVVGYDFAYGCQRTGTIETLRAHGERAGFRVLVVPPVEVDGVVASSTRIREALAAGDVMGAARLLGRDWDVDGPVVHGAKRGRTIGVPTANIATPGHSLPVRPGIYAVTLAVEGGPPLPAVASLGTNPTFVNDGQLVLEVHVLDWAGDLYDRVVRCRFVDWIRPEAKFDSIDSLVAQMHADMARARLVLNSRSIPG